MWTSNEMESLLASLPGSALLAALPGSALSLPGSAMSPADHETYLLSSPIQRVHVVAPLGEA